MQCSTRRFPQSRHGGAGFTFGGSSSLVNDWLKARGLVEWSLRMGEPNPTLYRGERLHDDGSRTPADFLYPYPPAAHYVGGGTSPRGVSHAVVMRTGKIVHDPHPDQDMTIDRIDSIHVYVRRDP